MLLQIKQALVHSKGMQFLMNTLQNEVSHQNVIQYTLKIEKMWYNIGYNYFYYMT